MKTENGLFYVFNNSKRYRFPTKRVMDSWAPQRVVEASESDAAVRRLTIASKMKFRNGSLLFSQATGKMYLVSDNKLRHITNPDVLTALNMQRKDAVWVSLTEINLHEIGAPLNA